jgi:alcohol dehydrogenase
LGDAVAEATDGRGADVALEFSGATAAVREGLDLCRVGGTLVLVGSVFPSDPVPIEPQQLVRRLLTVRGVHNYAPRDLAVALDFLAAHRERYDFGGLVQASFSLEQAEQAFRYALAERPVRVAVRP